MNLPAWITLDTSAPYPKWEMVDFQYIGVDHECNNAGVNVYVKGLDKDGNYVSGEFAFVYWATPDDVAQAFLRPEGELDYCGVNYGIAFEMTGDSSFNPEKGEAGPYACYMSGNSDRVQGMGLPMRRHVQYTITFRRADEGTEPPPVEANEWYIAKQSENRIVLRRKT